MPQAPSLRTDPFFTISILHLPTSLDVSFEGWVTQFSDSFTSNWSSTPVYGRQDPLPAFENTQRSITLGFDVVSDSMREAITNLAKINQLIEFLYPMYNKSKRSDQTILNAAPLLGIKWTNLISNAAQGEYLYGYIQGGVSYAPDMAEGGFIVRKAEGATTVEIPGPDGGDKAFDVFGSSLPLNGPITSYGARAENLITNKNVNDAVTKVKREDSYIPKKVSLSFSFNVLHTHLNGWDKDKSFGGADLLNRKFPNASAIKSLQTIVTTRQEDGTFNVDRTIQSLESEVLEGE